LKIVLKLIFRYYCHGCFSAPPWLGYNQAFFENPGGVGAADGYIRDVLNI
jgi:hypothetical protein